MPFIGFHFPELTLPDGLAAAFWLCGNFLLVAASCRLARRLFLTDDLLETLCHILILAWAVIAGWATILGFCGLLSGPILLVAVVLVAGALVAWLHFFARPTLPRGDIADAPERSWMVAWIGLCGLCLGQLLMAGLLRFPTNWDSLAYHIPLVDHWLQAGTLKSQQCARWSNPGNNELWAIWTVAPLSGDFLVSLNNVPAAVLLGCAAVSLGKRLGLSTPVAHLAGLGIVSNSVVLRQLVDAENDVAVAALFFAALLYVFRHLESESGAELYFGAASLGLLAGVKFYALGYAVLALVTWLMMTLVRRGCRPAGKVLLAGLAGMLALGGYWYLRNFALTGSPIYPRDLFHRPDQLDRIYPELATTSLFGNGRPELLGLFIEAIWAMAGPLQLAGFLLVPLTLAWLAGSAGWSFFRPGHAGPGYSKLALGILIGGCGIVLGITPFAVEDRPGSLNQMHMQYCPVRYGLCFLSMATIGALLVLQEGAGWLRQKFSPYPNPSRDRGEALASFFCLVLGGAILYQLFGAGQRLGVDWVNTLLVAGNVTLVGLNLALLCQLWPRLKLVFLWGFGVLLLLAGTCGCIYLAERWHEGFARHYDLALATNVFTWLEDKDFGDGTICALAVRYYPLFGSRRQHRLCQPIQVESPEWFLDYIEKQDIVLVVAVPGDHSPGWNQFQEFDKCLARYPDRFRKVHESGGWLVFQVVGR